MAAPHLRTRRLKVLLMQADAEAFAQRLRAGYRSVRFVIPRNRTVHRLFPAAAGLVDLRDALLDPGLDDDPPHFGSPDGVIVQLVMPVVTGNEIQTSTLASAFNEAHPGQVSFVTAAFRAMQESTKPHVEFLYRKPAPVRIGPNAERWWREDDQRSFVDESNPSIYYRVRDLGAKAASTDTFE